MNASDSRAELELGAPQTRRRMLLSMAGAFCAASVSGLAADTEKAKAAWKHEELKRFPAAEANQGVAVDGEFFYAITNKAIGKYRKDTGEKVASWTATKGEPFIHLNAGIVHEGKLYCAHSNFPRTPMVSSVEMWDVATLKHVGRHDFGQFIGSLTWLDRKDGHWIACFVHYRKNGGEPGRGPEETRIVKLDDAWKKVESWSLPSALIKKFGDYSSSGGGFGPEGKLFITGHDAKELYVLDSPKTGSVMEWMGTVPISAEGQAFNWDKKETGILYSIARKTKEVIISRVTR
jgi:outer membrane protein assembly factor BamB